MDKSLPYGRSAKPTRSQATVSRRDGERPRIAKANDWRLGRWIAGLREGLASDGFGKVFLPDAAPAEIIEIASCFGMPLSDIRGRLLLHEIRPQPREEAAKNTLSARYGDGVFPFHTDAAYWVEPPRYVLLYCVNPGSGKRPTVVSYVPHWRLTSGAQCSLTGEVWEVHRAREPFLSTVLCQKRGLLRFDEECMRPASGAQKAARVVQRAIKASPVGEIAWRQGDLVLLDNWRSLHARGKATRPDRDRRLQRVLVVQD